MRLKAYGDDHSSTNVSAASTLSATPELLADFEIAAFHCRLIDG
jgi:hypothetical protein